jgi:hypothetical protein
MGTKTTEHDFLQSITLGEVTNYQSSGLKIEIQKQRSPLQYKAKYFHKVCGQWQKFSDFVSNYVGDIIEDVKNEIKIYSGIIKNNEHI